MKKDIVVGIIGGTGGMGRFFEKVFQDHGYEVLISSRRTELTSKELAKKADAIFLSVPVDVAMEIAKEIGPDLREDQLLSDFCSQKESIVSCMVENTKAQVVGTHPMFGPFTESLNGQNVILCPGRGESWLEWLEEVFGKEDAVLTRMKPEKHDKNMAVVQGLTHLLTISMGKTMQKMGMSPKEAMAYSTPIFRLKVDFIGRLLALDLSLYNSLVGKNKYSGEALETLIESMKEGMEQMSDEDDNKGVAFLEEIKDFFGDFCETALHESNELLDVLYAKKS